MELSKTPVWNLKFVSILVFKLCALECHKCHNCGALNTPL